MIRLLQDYPLEPLLFIQRERALLFYQGHAYTLDGPLRDRAELPLDIFSLRKESPSCIALIEWDSVTQAEHLLWGFLVPIFASSPNTARTRPFKDRMRPYVWGIPTWSFHEIKAG